MNDVIVVRPSNGATLEELKSVQFSAFHATLVKPEQPLNALTLMAVTELPIVKYFIFVYPLKEGYEELVGVIFLPR